jgi:hypothetical protein
MELNFEPPVEGECIGSMSVVGKFFYHVLITLPLLSLMIIVPMVCLFTHHYLYAILSFVLSIVLFAIGYKTISDIQSGWRLIYMNDGFYLDRSRKIQKIGLIVLDNNTLEVVCEYEIKRLLITWKPNHIINTGYHFIIEKRFSDKPHLLVEFLNTHARNTTPLLEK